MDSHQLFSGATSILRTVRDCGLTAAVRSGSASVVSAASVRYMDAASGFSAEEQAVARSAGMDRLQSPTYWFDLEAGSDRERTEHYRRCLKTIVQGLSFLTRLASLVENRADPLDLNDDACDIKIRLVDAADRASDPDRIARLIDGVDLIYRACAKLAHTSLDGLHVMRVGGAHGRTVLLQGDVDPATATRRIIRAANDIATGNIQGESYSADEVADSNPFMQSLDDLFRVGALSAADAEEIRHGVLTGTIMVLECGGRLFGVDAVGDPVLFGQPTDRSPAVTTASDEAEAEADELEYLKMDRNKK